MALGNNIAHFNYFSIFMHYKTYVYSCDVVLFFNF